MSPRRHGLVTARAYVSTMHLLPRDDDSLTELQGQARLLDQTLPHLDGLLKGTEIAASTDAIRKLEAEGDRMLRRIGQKLRDTFITPLDRDGLLNLAHRLDDVLDAVDALAFRLSCYRITQIEDGPCMAGSMRDAVAAVVAAVDLLPEHESRQPLLGRCAQIGELKRAAQEQLRRSLEQLFSTERTATVLIQCKDFYELSAAVTARCCDVAEALESLLLDA